jgi:transporter family protein
MTAPWLPYAMLSALFAARPAIFASARLKEQNPGLAIAVCKAPTVLMAWG